MTNSLTPNWTKILTLLMLALPLGALAASLPDAEGACKLLGADDLRTLGILPESAPLHNTLNLEAEQTGAPTRIHAELCFAYHGIQGSRRTLGLTVERYEHSDGVAEWLDRQNRKAEGDKALVTRIGEATCERGDYAHVSSAQADLASRQHYLSCDRLSGSNRLALTVETPDSEADLPTDGMLAGLLERVLERIK